MQRRRFLRAVATPVPALAAGCQSRSEPTTSRTTTAGDADRNRSPAHEGARSAESRAAGQQAQRRDFCWLERPLWEDRGVRENLLSFARRHHLAALFAHPDSNDDRVARTLAEPLQAAAESGVEAWLNVGVLTDLTPEEFVTDREKRRSHLAGLRTAATAYRTRFPRGKIVLWQEAPVGGTWVEGGAWSDAAVSNLERYGPEIFAAQKRVVENVAPDVDVGIFVHFPYIVPSRQPDTFGTVIDGLQRRGAMPDFAFVDFYRGWYEKDVGPERANDAIEGLVANAKAHVGEVYYLGQSHTINPHHTPSKQAIRMDLRASAAADGRGWYARTRYTETERGFDPFVPNVGIDRDDARASTVTFARDRYLYAYVSLLAAGTDFVSERKFDCWIHARNVGFHEHRLSLRTANGDWEFIGDLGGYVDGTPYSSADRVSIFHALDRDRFVVDGTLTGRIEPIDGGSPVGGSTGTSTNGSGGVVGGDSTLVSVSAVPFDAGAYVPEHRARTLLDSSGFGACCLGYSTVDARLTPDRPREFRVPITDPDSSGLSALLFPDHRAYRRRLTAFESREGFDPEETFDCWVTTDRTEARATGKIPTSAVSVSTSSGDSRDSHRSLADASAAVSSTPACFVFSGLDRDLLRRSDGESFVVGVDHENWAVERAYAMPYFGSDNLLTATRARSLIRADTDEIETFSVARASSTSID